GAFLIDSNQWIAIEALFEKSGRYKVEVVATSAQNDAEVWVEDYYDNTDGRTYDVTGKIAVIAGSAQESTYKEGSPFKSGLHQMKLHVTQGEVVADKIIFTLMKAHVETPATLTQMTEGDTWEIVWSDEFET
ncbi:MAG: hypothetical protein ACK4IY_10360, partial [Chitinophagales bacterium]